MTRLTLVVDGRRIGSIILDGTTARLVVAPTSTEQELWDALAEVYGALQGRERAEVKSE